MKDNKKKILKEFRKLWPDKKLDIFSIKSKSKNNIVAWHNWHDDRTNAVNYFLVTMKYNRVWVLKHYSKASGWKKVDKLLEDFSKKWIKSKPNNYGAKKEKVYNVSQTGSVRVSTTKKSLRLIIGGPPHSGKSTFMTLLYSDLADKHVDVELVDLDYASPTIAWMLGAKVRGTKKEWTQKLAKEAHSDFKRVSKKHDISLGDSPGRITDITETITKGADGAVILSKNSADIPAWKSFFKRMKVPVIAVVDSRLKGFSIYSHKHDRGRATKLSREDLRAGNIDDDNIVIESLSHEIGERLGIDLRNEMR